MCEELESQALFHGAIRGIVFTIVCSGVCINSAINVARILAEGFDVVIRHNFTLVSNKQQHE